jgi:hypothetical protein
MFKNITVVKAALVTAEDKPPLAPYTPLKKAPPKFPYEEYALMPPDDARKIMPTLDALNERADALQTIEEQAKSLRVGIEEKIVRLKQTKGYDKIAQEMNELKEKLATEVEATVDRVGDVLLEYNETVLGIMQQTAEGKATTPEIQEALVEAIKKFASPEIAGQIIEEADAVIKAAADAHKKVQRRLVSWPSPQDLRKKVREELPKGAEASTKTALVEGIKSFFSGLLSTMKSAWATLSDKLSSLWTTTQKAMPLINEIKRLAEEAGFQQIQATKESNMEKSAAQITYSKTAYVHTPAGILDQLNNQLSNVWATGQENLASTLDDIVEDIDQRDDLTSEVREFLEDLVAQVDETTGDVIFHI